MNIVTDCKVVTQPEVRKQIVYKSGHCFVVVISVGSVTPIQVQPETSQYLSSQERTQSWGWKFFQPSFKSNQSASAVANHNSLFIFRSSPTIIIIIGNSI